MRKRKTLANELNLETTFDDFFSHGDGDSSYIVDEGCDFSPKYTPKNSHFFSNQDATTTNGQNSAGRRRLVTKVH